MKRRPRVEAGTVLIWPCVMVLMLNGLAARGRGEDAVLIDRPIDFSGAYSQTIELSAGQVVELSAGFRSPSKLPDNGRVAVEWSGPNADAGFRKVLHALDPDVYVVYRAPQQGRYTLSLRAVEDEEPAPARRAGARTESWRRRSRFPD